MSKPQSAADLEGLLDPEPTGRVPHTGCPHLRHQAHVQVYRTEGLQRLYFTAEVLIRCAQCGTAFTFRGEERLVLPIEPKS